jgi:hypothetical protein
MHIRHNFEAKNDNKMTGSNNGFSSSSLSLHEPEERVRGIRKQGRDVGEINVDRAATRRITGRDEKSSRGKSQFRVPGLSGWMV